MIEDENDVDAISPALADALAALLANSIRVASCGMARLPAVHRAQIQGAVDAESCALTVQIDLPDGAVRVLADGAGWLKPQVLFAVDFKKAEAPRPS